MSVVRIPKDSIVLSGIVFGYSTPRRHKAATVIVVHPGGGVKEQTASTYAKRLSEKGYVTICFDASHQGASGGEPRLLESPSERVTDIMAVVDYAQKLELTDSDRIGVVGICAGGGYAVAAAKTDHRIKAVAIISAVNIGDGVRKGWFGDDKPSKQLANLAQIAATMSAEARGVPAAVSTYVPPKLDRHTPRDLQEAHQYYLTTRAWHINAPNKMLVRSAPLLLAFDAWHFADLFLNQPILIIYGD